MKLNHSIHFLLLFLLTGWVAVLDSSSSSYISYDAFESYGTTGRTLLQTKTKCTEDFENKNYTVITSQCKGPQYPTDECCEALKEFACPFVDKINDLTNDCSITMFSYINLYGKFPPGLFANKCREGKQGLECKDVPVKSGCHVPAAASQTTLLMLAAGIIVFITNVLMA
ncbi:hypothetical protein Ddye_018596 [Dipteronia dyeriana]|uniref:GPI-anchored protein LLG1-like domain-containing protein n=1 Tax=Dipteronia dyeriana TaxID=168575 RepID=A0AAD9X204_9ROSI|nr:hypothetical protein Ddye_018596 [Dipteronia dyeriana]